MTDPRLIAARRRAMHERTRDDSLAWVVEQIGAMRRQGDPAQFNRRDPTFSTLKCPDGAKLAAASGTVALPAATLDGLFPSNPQVFRGDYQDVLRSEAGESWARGIHLWSRNNNNSLAVPVVAPFEAIIEWTSGGGFSGRLYVTASAGAVSIYVNCITVVVRVANWDVAINNVICTVEEGAAPQTQDLHKSYVSINLVAGTTETFAVPPYARYVSVITADPGERAGITMELLDSAGNIIAAEMADTFNELWVGPAVSVRIRNGNIGPLTSSLIDFKLGWN